MGMFNFVDNRKVNIPVPGWARKVGKIVAVVFDLDSGSHVVSPIGNKETFTDSNVGQALNSPDAWKVFNDRKSVFTDIERMLNEDELVSTAVDIVADRALGNTDARQSFKKKIKRTSFAVSSSNPEVKRIIDNLNRRLGIERDIWQIIHEFYPQGNCFREVIIDRKSTPMKIKGFKQTISYQIWPKVNEHGDKLPGWLVITDQDVASQKGKELEEWQIVPFIYGVKKGFLAIAPLASARRNWQRLTSMEDGMVTARSLRAYDKVVHRIPVKETWQTTEIMATIKRYKDAITKRKLVASDGSLASVDNPLAVDTDYFLPDDGTGKGGVSILTANNAQLGNLNDVLYAREKLIARLKVPTSYLQLTSAQKTHITGGGTSNADIAFAFTLQRVQDVVIEGLSRLYDMELMFNGIAPEEELYTIELAPIIPKDRVEDANIELTYAQAAVYFVEAFGALPADLIADKFMQLNREQQEMMDTFLNKDANKIWKAKLKSIESEATPAPVSGSGNQNKSRAKRTTEQVGKPKQSISLNDLTDIMYQMYDSMAEDMRNNGQDTPALNEADRDEIKQSILSYVNQNVELTL